MYKYIVSFLVGFVLALPIPVEKPVGGIVLMGGGTCTEGIEWMMNRAVNPSFVILTCSEHHIPDNLFQKYNLVPNILKADSKELADSDSFVDAILKAGAIFISGGDQALYHHYWYGSRIIDAIQKQLGKVPIGGTSAGLAILGEYYFSAEYDTIYSETAVANPDIEVITIRHKLLDIPLFKNTIMDTHYTERDRLNRHIVFMGRIMQEYGVDAVIGIGVDECTSVCIENDGSSKVFGRGDCYILESTGKILDKGKINSSNVRITRFITGQTIDMKKAPTSGASSLAMQD